MHTTAIINQKGGVAKTTTAHALAAGLALRGKRVLAVDMDAQANLTAVVRGAQRAAHTTLEILTQAATVAQARRRGDIDLIPAGASLAAADRALKRRGSEYSLKTALQAVASEYDYAIIDSPPSLGILAVAALVAADDCIVPTQADIFSLQALDKLQDTLEVVRAATGNALPIMGILLTRYNKRAILSREAAELIEGRAVKMGTKVFDTKIRECIAIKEAQAVRESIFEYAPRSNAAADYKAFVGELIKRGY